MLIHHLHRTGRSLGRRSLSILLQQQQQQQLISNRSIHNNRIFTQSSSIFQNVQRQADNVVQIGHQHKRSLATAVTSKFYFFGRLHDNISF